MLTFTLLAALSESAFACPGEVASVTLALTDAKEARRQARERVHQTDWDFRLATEDRDKVLAEQAAASEQLKAARQAVRESRSALRQVSAKYTAEERECSPDELEAARIGPSQPAPAPGVLDPTAGKQPAY